MGRAMIGAVTIFCSPLCVYINSLLAIPMVLLGAWLVATAKSD
jgi:hypothetical protein